MSRLITAIGFIRIIIIQKQSDFGSSGIPTTDTLRALSRFDGSVFLRLASLGYGFVVDSLGLSGLLVTLFGKVLFSHVLLFKSEILF